MTITLLLLCTAGFFGALVDSIAGGGGIITVPAFLMAGVPPHIALGTNKFASTCASFTSSVKFATSSKVDFKLIKILAPFTIIGAVLGVNSVLAVNGGFLNTVVLILLTLVGLYSLFSKTVGVNDNFKGLNKKNIVSGIFLAIGLGFYDGFFGPGTGSFLIFGMIGVYGFDFVRAGGNGKVLNFLSNITSLIVFAFNFQINYSIGIPVALSMILGARFGTTLALNKGAKLMKPIFVTMSLGVAVKMLYGILSK
ncbi:MAG: TSUP family transporter [Solirubrobacterales bacterium]